MSNYLDDFRLNMKYYHEMLGILQTYLSILCECGTGTIGGIKAGKAKTSFDILSALDSDWTDFEDSVQNSVAESHEYDAIITRNKGDYKKSSIKVFSPNEFIEEIKGNK